MNNEKKENFTELIKIVKESTDVKTLMEQFGVRGKGFAGGTKYRCACPIHGGDNPTAFVFSNETKKYYCHTNKCTGDVISFVQKLSKCDFRTAVQRLAKINGMDLSEFNEQTLYVAKANDFLHTMIAMDESIQNKKIELMRGYVNGILDYSQLDIFPVLPYRHMSMESRRNISFETQLDFDIRVGRITFDPNFKDPFKHIRYIIPMHDELGNYIGICGRSWNKKLEPKYWYYPKDIKKSMFVFNLNRAKYYVGSDDGEDIDTLFVCEGSYDVFKFWSYDIKNSVAVFGSDPSDAQVDLLLRYAKRLILCFHNDPQGRHATQKILKMIAKRDPDCEILIFPIPYDKNDVDDMEDEEIMDAVSSCLTPAMWKREIENRIDIVEKFE